MLLFFRDIIDFYKMGDGDRIVRNVYFEWLYVLFFYYIKYIVWLWRMIVYVDDFLFLVESMEYKWNMIMNLKGGI